ncbi:hypothetical protein D9M71_643030 [compost metagenome]
MSEYRQLPRCCAIAQSNSAIQRPPFGSCFRKSPQLPLRNLEHKNKRPCRLGTVLAGRRKQRMKCQRKRAVSLTGKFDAKRQLTIGSPKGNGGRQTILWASGARCPARCWTAGLPFDSLSSTTSSGHLQHCLKGRAWPQSDGLTTTVAVDVRLPSVPPFQEHRRPRFPGA